MKNVHGDDMAEDSTVLEQYRSLPAQAGMYEMSAHHTGHARVVAVSNGNGNGSGSSNAMPAPVVSTPSSLSGKKVSFRCNFFSLLISTDYVEDDLGNAPQGGKGSGK